MLIKTGVSLTYNQVYEINLTVYNIVKYHLTHLKNKLKQFFILSQFLEQDKFSNSERRKKASSIGQFQSTSVKSSIKSCTLEKKIHPRDWFGLGLKKQSMKREIICIIGLHCFTTCFYSLYSFAKSSPFFLEEILSIFSSIWVFFKTIDESFDLLMIKCKIIDRHTLL